MWVSVATSPCAGRGDGLKLVKNIHLCAIAVAAALVAAPEVPFSDHLHGVLQLVEVLVTPRHPNSMGQSRSLGGEGDGSEPCHEPQNSRAGSAC